MVKIQLVIISLAAILIFTSFTGVSFTEALLPENVPDFAKALEKVRVIHGEKITAYARALYTTLDDPSNHEVPTSDPHDGVAKLILARTDGTFGCSGTLASGAQHIITAAHCVTDNNGNYVLLSGPGSSATFEGNSESIVITIDPDPLISKAHPDYDGDFIKGNDIAVLKLELPAPARVPEIPHATSDNSVTLVGDKKGYGWSGFLSSGADSSTYPFGTKRDGQNLYDDFADTMYLALNLNPNTDFVPQAIYQYDSDDGNSLHDAFDFFFGNSDLGLATEVISAPGDSGGPTILNGELVGVTSYGITLEFTRGPPPRTSDCTTEGKSPILDSSCGEFAGDTRVSHYTDFIASVLNTVNDEEPPVISAINVDASSTTATITWTTNEPATSLVDYGTDDNYGLSVSDTNYVTSHSIELSGLSSSTNYHFMVTSVDAANNPASSGDTQFTTASPPTLVSISISPVNPSITEGSTQQFTATGTYSDDTNQVLTDATWSSSLTTVATINGDGLATGISADSTIITAISGGQEDTTILQVTAAPEEPTTASVSSITYSTHGGRDNSKHLDITITIINDFANPVSGASVSIDLFRDSSFVAQGTGTTETDGTVTFTLNNASPGLYTTIVTDVTAAGLTWDDGVTPFNEFPK